MAVGSWFFSTINMLWHAFRNIKCVAYQKVSFYTDIKKERQSTFLNIFSKNAWKKITKNQIFVRKHTEVFNPEPQNFCQHQV
jgi:hypothetical protein